MSQLTKTQLENENNNSFPNNNSGFITPTLLRTFNENMIDSLVDEGSYNADSASFSGSIAALQNFSSSLDGPFATQAELTQTASILQADINTKATVTGSNTFVGQQTFNNGIAVGTITDIGGNIAIQSNVEFSNNVDVNGNVAVTGSIKIDNGTSTPHLIFDESGYLVVEGTGNGTKIRGEGEITLQTTDNSDVRVVNSDFVVDDTLFSKSRLVATGSISNKGITTLEGNTFISGNLKFDAQRNLEVAFITASAVSASNIVASNINSTFITGSTVSVASRLNVTGSTNISGSTTITGSTNILGNTSIVGNITGSGNLRVGGVATFAGLGNNIISG